MVYIQKETKKGKSNFTKIITLDHVGSQTSLDLKDKHVLAYLIGLHQSSSNICNTC